MCGSDGPNVARCGRYQKQEMTMGGYYDFNVSLADIEPRIWRRFLIAADATFADLHQAIQDAFGWDGGHLWEFMEPSRKGGIIAGAPNFGFDEGTDVPDAGTVSLTAFFGGKGGAKKCLYLYDFGDGWYHHVVLKKTVSDSGDFRQQLVGGERAGPLEDCGGVPGYERMAAFVVTGEDPYGDDPEELADWIDDWHPDEFDLEAVKQSFDR